MAEHGHGEHGGDHGHGDHGHEKKETKGSYVKRLLSLLTFPELIKFGAERVQGIFVSPMKNAVTSGLGFIRRGGGGGHGGGSHEAHGHGH